MEFITKVSIIWKVGESALNHPISFLFIEIENAGCRDEKSSPACIIFRSSFLRPGRCFESDGGGTLHRNFQKVSKCSFCPSL